MYRSQASPHRIGPFSTAPSGVPIACPISAPIRANRPQARTRVRQLCCKRPPSYEAIDPVDLEDGGCSGAPHFHLAGVFARRIGNERLETWLTRNWAEIVDSGDDNHYRAGTRIDWSEGLDASDPNRLAAYFGAYASGKGSKEYQHHAPENWANPNGSHGRHWGARNVTYVRAELRVSRAQLIEIQRFLRRYVASQKRTMRTKGIGGQRSRAVNRRWTLRSLVGTESGFTLLTNDGPSLAVAIARATTPHQEEPWLPGQRRPLP